MKSLQERCQTIELLLVDVDGVLSDGGINYDATGTEIKNFHVRDGSGIKLWQRAGKRVGIISGRTSPCSTVRAAELGMKPVVQGSADKLADLDAIVKDLGLSREQVCFVGDDIPDLPVLRNCGLAAAVADACPEVVADVHYVTRQPGGRGAVREVIELILKCQGIWTSLVNEYRL